ncbi:class IV adenylate cyclase [Streptomyces sp. NPDC046939]|uniref:class IV adenylate cyclase n=1 Tax=Streptomyces sp. NPDC046939 TaxID=3155376 RepID=UPI00340F3913
MPVEAELKARVRSPEEVVARLDGWAEPRVEVYRDTYYDRPGEVLGRADQELRVRTVHNSGSGDTRTVLTFKAAAVDEGSGSKPEYETHVDDADATHAILRGLGYVEVIAFEKHCRNYSFVAHGRRMLATLVRVPELDGTFIELEAIVDASEVGAALEDVRSVLAELGIAGEDLTRETYTSAVAARRG